MLGAIFVFHGAQKLFGWWDGPGLPGFAAWLQQLSIPLPAYAAVLAGAAEFFGGCFLVTGIGIRWAVLPLIATMGVAIYYVHRSAFSVQEQGMEYPLTLAVLLVGMALTGPGRWSLSALPWSSLFLRRTRVIHTLSDGQYQSA